jgi:high-affinity iron transporter
MNFRLQSYRATWLWLLLTLPVLARGQVNPVKRIADIVTVAIAEYTKGIDSKGRLISAMEYQEAVDFLAEARVAAVRLPSERSGAIAILDTIIAAVAANRLPSEVVALEARFKAALGSDAALDLPRTRLRPDSGRLLYQANCASCHGTSGMGDGPAAKGLNPPPPALGSRAAMETATPELMYRMISIGVTGTAMPGYEGKLSSTDRWNVVAYLTELRHRDADVALGEGLYTQSCAACHGVVGVGDGPLARQLSKLPPELGSFAWQAQRSDSQLSAAIRVGVPGSPMPPMPSLSPAQDRALVAYLRSLAIRETPIEQSTDSNDARSAARRSLAMLEQSLNAARSGRTDDAADRATDAYLAFEPVETRSRQRNPGLVLVMEQRYAKFKGMVRSGNVREAEQLGTEIEAMMPSVLALTTPTGSGFDAFWQSFLIILREGLEAILVIGAIVTFLLKTGHRERLRSIWIGVALALLASAATAIVLKTILSSIPASREIIEGATMLIAVAVLFSVSYWLISRVEAAKWQQFIKEKVTVALEHGGGRALAFVAFLAVYREGAETALFYQALINDGSTNVLLPIALGILAGFAVLAVVFTLFYRFGVRLPIRTFFAVTSVLLYYMAFVFMGKGIRELQEGDAVTATFINRFPTVDALGIYPTWETILAQLALLLLFAFAVLKTFWPARSVALPTVQPVAPTPPPQIEQLLARIDALEKRLEGR